MRIAVVGGGVAGLTCALQLRDRGHQPIVLEREAQAGGKVRTEQSGGWRIEHGPIALLDNAPSTRALFRRLALDPELVTAADEARHRFVIRDGRLREVPDSPPKLIFSRTLSLAEKWRLFREPAAAPAPLGVDETVAEFARRRVGASLAEAFVEPMVTGIFAADYARLSMASAFPRVVEMERAHGSLLGALRAAERERRNSGRPRTPTPLLSLKGGLGALPARLARELGDALRTGTRLLALDRLPDRAGFRLSTESGALEVERVVWAAPAGEAAQLTRSVCAELADAYAEIPEVGVACVSLGWPRGEVAHPLAGFGFLVPRREGLRLLGAQWITSTFPTEPLAPAGHVMIRCLIGGAHDPEAVALPEEALVQIARDGLRAALALEAPPTFTHLVRWARAIPQYQVRHASRVACIEERGSALGLFATGAPLRGVGLNDVVREAVALADRIAGG